VTPEKILERYSANHVVELIAPLLLDERKKRINQVLERRVASVHVALESPADIHNALAVTRSGEALGVFHFHLVSAQLVKGRGKSTMRGSSRWIHIHKHSSIHHLRKNLKGVVLAGAAPVGEKTLEELPTDRPLCLLFGNEHQGLSKEAIDECDVLYRIPMRGMVESFNLSVSAAISLYSVMKQRAQGDLSPKELTEERARYYIKSIGVELARDLLLREEIMKHTSDREADKGAADHIA